MALNDTLNFFTYEQLESYTYDMIDGTQYFSVRTALTYDRDKIGVPPHNICNVEFESTSAIDKWECRATLEDGPFGVGVGLLVQGGDSVAEHSPKSFQIVREQFPPGAWRYRITIYVKKYGIWYGGE